MIILHSGFGKVEAVALPAKLLADGVKVKVQQAAGGKPTRNGGGTGTGTGTGSSSERESASGSATCSIIPTGPAGP